ncbi:AAA family ATPase [uncultured Clostridium sp.]|uniref:AAA family ATPase n=1 Tax=uncultured Clostridium sp. TaxID=59620 RepID=UPI002627A565|nr:AAA family ATPase [uncultured Clostridium sp.]
MSEDKYDKNGFDEKGIHKNGTYYDEFGFDAFGKNEEGLSFNQVFPKNGYTKDGYDKYGFNKEGFNREGIHKDSKNGSIDIEEELNRIIGLENVKNIIKEQHNILLARELRRKNDVNVEDTQALNMIFTGNPGTGKTMAARLIGKLFKEFGILREEKIVEVDRSMLVGQYQGATAKKTREVFKSALGGVLIIDEAYSLYNGEMDESGMEAINTIVKLIEDYRNEVVVILTGYKKEMNDFMETNMGIKSRFSFQIEFNDYNLEELKKIFFNMIEERGFILEDNLEEFLNKRIEEMLLRSDRASGNGRMIRNLVEDVIRKQSLRIVKEKREEGLNLIIKEDIDEQRIVHKTNLKDELEKIVGKKDIKEFLTLLNARLSMNNERRKLGLFVEASLNNMVFKGGVGTGKSMIAKTVSTLFYNNRILKTRNIVEVTRGDLVASYIGQTSIKTRKKIKEAVGGVLYIDDAQNLLNISEGDFGTEAINEIAKGIDIYGDNILIILSGEKEGIQKLLDLNPHLKARFKHNIEFKNYSLEELTDILLGKLENGGYTLDLITLEKIKEYLGEENTLNNGRYIEEVYEKIQMNMAKRIYKKKELTKEDLTLIKEEDIY